MTKTKFLTLTVILLLVLNVILLMGSMKPLRKKIGHDIKVLVIETLQLDEQQQVKYDALVIQHQMAIVEHETLMRQTRQTLFGQSTTATERVSLLNQIRLTQGKIDSVHVTHFDAIEKLCRPDQVAHFDALRSELLRLFGPAVETASDPKPPRRNP